METRGEEFGAFVGLMISKYPPPTTPPHHPHRQQQQQQQQQLSNTAPIGDLSTTGLVRFAGQWERNMQQGFGVYVSPGGRERYVGEWRNGKKHGYGRWITTRGSLSASYDRLDRNISGSTVSQMSDCCWFAAPQLTKVCFSFALWNRPVKQKAALVKPNVHGRDLPRCVGIGGRIPLSNPWPCRMNLYR